MSWLLCVCRHREWARIRRSFEAAAAATLQRCRCSTGPQAPRVTVACNYNILQVSQLYCIETAVCFKKGLFNALPLLTVKPICVEYGFQPSNPSVIEHNLSFFETLQQLPTQKRWELFWYSYLVRLWNVMQYYGTIYFRNIVYLANDWLLILIEFHIWILLSIWWCMVHNKWIISCPQNSQYQMAR